MKTEGQITICGFEDWYLNSESSKETSIQRWLKEEEHALESGYRGLRISGKTSFVEQRAWAAFYGIRKAHSSGLERETSHCYAATMRPDFPGFMIATFSSTTISASAVIITAGTFWIDTSHAAHSSGRPR
jgi:hypothetical protein